MKLSPAVRKIEFGDCLLLFYALVFVRQYAWLIPSDATAWIVTIILTLAIWLAYVNFKPRSEERSPWPRFSVHWYMALLC